MAIFIARVYDLNTNCYWYNTDSPMYTFMQYLLLLCNQCYICYCLIMSVITYPMLILTLYWKHRPPLCMSYIAAIIGRRDTYMMGTCMQSSTIMSTCWYIVSTYMADNHRQTVVMDGRAKNIECIFWVVGIEFDVAIFGHWLRFCGYYKMMAQLH